MIRTEKENKRIQKLKSNDYRNIVANYEKKLAEVRRKQASAK